MTTAGLFLVLIGSAAVPSPTLAARAGAPVSIAGDTLRGRVMDAQGQPVAGARVTLAELSTATRTDAAGAFAFGVARGRYTVVVEGSGFVSATQTVTVPSAETIDITVQEGVLRLDPVNVTATRAPADAMRSPLPVTMMGEERVRREHSVSLAKAVSQLAGVHAVSTGEQIGKPVLRGLSGARVLVLENGHRLEDYSWSDEDGPSVESRLEQRIEVIRGPASVLYGSDAIGGVINALPAALPDATSGHGFGRGEVEAYAASNNREVGTALRYEGASGRLGWRAFLVGRFGEDLHTPAGKLENTGFGAANGEILLGMHSGAGTSTLRYSRYGGEFKLLEANGPPPGTEPAEEEGPERKLSDDRVQFDGNYLVGPVRLETKGQWQRHFISELSDDLSQGGQKVETEVFNLVLNTLTGDVLLHHGGERQSGSVGVSFFHQNNDTRGVVPLVPDAGISSFAGFAFEQWNADHVSLLGGARLERRAVDAKANSGLGLSHESRDYTVAVGNLGLVLRAADGLALALNAGRAWRAPNLFEMFANGPRLGEARYEIGRADLEAETSFNLDAALRWERPRLRGELAAYRNRISNYIHVTPTSDFINNLRVFRYLQGDATLTGGEVSLEAVPTRALTVRGRYDRVHADNDESDEPLPLVPPATGAIEAELHRAHFGWVEQGYLGAELEFAAKKSRLAANELGTDGYTLVHFEAGVQHRFGARRLRLDLRLRNATNVSYRNFLSRYKEFAEDPGRNIVLRLSTEL